MLDEYTHSKVEVKNEWNYNSSPVYAFMEGKEQLYLFKGKAQCHYNTPGGINYIKQRALKG